MYLQKDYVFFSCMPYFLCYIFGILHNYVKTYLMHKKFVFCKLFLSTPKFI